ELHDHPDEPVILYEFGKVLLELGQPAEALVPLRRCKERVLPSEPALPRLYCLLAQALDKLGRKTEALAEYRAGLGRFPDQVELPAFELAWRGLGETWAAQKRFPELAQAAQRLEAEQPALASKLRALVPAPQAIADRPRVSLCMIVKNEEANLEACLRSVADL